MEYAKSLIDGRLYSASQVSYYQTTKLKLVCPQCHQKVFKSKRTVPNESHFFCHHPGVGIGCELYHEGALNPGSFSISGDFDSKGQFLKVFIQNVSNDIQACMYQSRILDGNINKIKFNQCQDAAQDSFVNLHRRGSLNDISILINRYLIGKPQDVISRANTIAEFYKNEQSRFIDKVIFTWICYYIYNDLPNADLKLLSTLIIKDKNIFEKFCCIFIVGLSSYYLSKSLISMKTDFLNSISLIGNIYQKQTLNPKRDEIQAYINEHGVLPGWEGRHASKVTEPKDILSKITTNKWILSDGYLINESAGLKIPPENYVSVGGGMLGGFEIRGYGNLAWVRNSDVIKKS